MTLTISVRVKDGSGESVKDEALGGTARVEAARKFPASASGSLGLSLAVGHLPASHQPDRQPASTLSRIGGGHTRGCPSASGRLAGCNHHSSQSSNVLCSASSSTSPRWPGCPASRPRAYSCRDVPARRYGSFAPGMSTRRSGYLNARCTSGKCETCSDIK